MVNVNELTRKWFLSNIFKTTLFGSPAVAGLVQLIERLTAQRGIACLV